MARLASYLVLVVLATLATLASCQRTTADYLTLGHQCNPRPDQDRCFPGSSCNRRTRVCDCSDSQDGTFKRTFENNECRLLPGSTCIPRVDQEFYRCVQNSECTVTRQGQDPRECPADGRCDPGDAECICPPGQNCLSRKFRVPPSQQQGQGQGQVRNWRK